MERKSWEKTEKRKTGVKPATKISRTLRSEADFTGKRHIRPLQDFLVLRRQDMHKTK